MEKNDAVRFFFLLTVLTSLFLSGTLYAQTNTVTFGDDTRTIDADMFGYNGKTTAGPLWTDTVFQNVVARIYPGNIRYPGGTAGNYFDWRTGTFIPGTGKSSNYPYPIPEYVAGIPDITTIIYMVNLARPTPSTGIPFDTIESVLESEEVLQLKIDDILDAIETFEENGKLPRRIEFGNEFYFTSEHGAIYAGNPSLYMSHAAVLARAIREQYPRETYPGLKIGLITSKGGSTGRDFWNQTVYDSLESNAQLAADIDAVTLHWYIGDEFGPASSIRDADGAETAVAQAFENVDNRCREDYDRTPDWLEIWNTEYSTNDDNPVGRDCWASGIRAAALTLNYFGMGDQMRCMNLHNINVGVINEQNKLDPNGFACGLICRAARGKNNARDLAFSSNPSFVKTFPSLIGWKFWNNDSEAVVIVNCSQDRFDDVDLSAVISSSDKTCISRYSETPWQSGATEVSGIEENIWETDSTTVSIPSFSITLAEGPVSNLSVIPNNVGTSDLELKCFKPNTAQSTIHIVYSVPQRMTMQLQIFDVRGNRVKNFEKQNIEAGVHKVVWQTGCQPAGLYFVRLKAGTLKISTRFLHIK